MKTKKFRLLSYCLTIGLIFILILGMAACVSTLTSTLTLISIIVTPSSPANLTLGATQQFAAVGTYSDGSTKDVSPQVTWTSNSSAVTIDPTGLATGKAIGIANIAAALPGIPSTPAILKVVALSSIVITPTSPASLAVGSTLQVEATATYSDGSTADISSQVNWSSYTNAAVVNSTGLVSGVSVGSAYIFASISGITSPAVTFMVVDFSALSSIKLSPASPPILAVGSTQQFTAIGTYSNGLTADLTSQVTWASDNTKVAAISSNGLATGVAAGTAHITAALSGVANTAVSLNVESTNLTTSETPTTTP